MNLCILIQIDLVRKSPFIWFITQFQDVLDYYEFNDDNELLQRLLNSSTGIQVYKLKPSEYVYYHLISLAHRD